MNPKKIALISTFCDNEEKQKVLHETILEIKQMGIDVMAISPNFIPVEKEVIELCDFFFYTKENPLLKWPQKIITQWYELPISHNRSVVLNRGSVDYGWAALYQVKKLSQLALTFEYDIFYHLVYDLEFDSSIRNEFLNNDVNLLHQRRTNNLPEGNPETTLHFMIFDKPMMQKIESEINLLSYLNDSEFAESELLKWVNKYDLKISENFIKDRIYYWQGMDLFNISPFSEFKMFLSKGLSILNHKNCENFRICFYGFDKINEIRIQINENWYTVNPICGEYQEFPILSHEIENLKCEYDGENVDLTQEYDKIYFNEIFYKDK